MQTRPDLQANVRDPGNQPLKLAGCAGKWFVGWPLGARASCFAHAPQGASTQAIPHHSTPLRPARPTARGRARRPPSRGGIEPVVRSCRDASASSVPLSVGRAPRPVGRAPRRRASRTGSMGARLSEHRNNEEILRFEKELHVTWAAVSDVQLRKGMERCLGRVLVPRVGSRFPRAAPVEVNLPWRRWHRPPGSQLPLGGEPRGATVRCRHPDREGAGAVSNCGALPWLAATRRSSNLEQAGSRRTRSSAHGGSVFLRKRDPTEALARVVGPRQWGSTSRFASKLHVETAVMRSLCSSSRRELSSRKTVACVP